MAMAAPKPAAAQTDSRSGEKDWALRGRESPKGPEAVRSTATTMLVGVEVAMSFMAVLAPMLESPSRSARRMLSANTVNQT